MQTRALDSVEPAPSASARAPTPTPTPAPTRTRTPALVRLHDRLTDAAFALACAALLVMLGSYLVEVALRYGFDAPTRWSADVVTYALLVASAFALPMVTRERGHVAITSFVERLAPHRRARLQRALTWTGALALLATASLFALVAIEQRTQGIETVAAFAVPKWWLTAVAGWGLLDSGLHMLRHALARHASGAGQELEL